MGSVETGLRRSWSPCRSTCILRYRLSTSRGHATCRTRIAHAVLLCMLLHEQVLYYTIRADSSSDTIVCLLHVRTPRDMPDRTLMRARTFARTHASRLSCVNSTLIIHASFSLIAYARSPVTSICVSTTRRKVLQWARARACVYVHSHSHSCERCVHLYTSFRVARALSRTRVLACYDAVCCMGPHLGLRTCDDTALLRAAQC
jgi:hypothetical protein